jgi:hypothetical protein
MRHLFEHRESVSYRTHEVEIEKGWGPKLTWKHPSSRVMAFGAKDFWSQDFHVEHEGTIEAVKEQVLPPLSPSIKGLSPFFLWHPNTARPVIHPPSIELLSYPTTPVSVVRERGATVVAEHLAKAEGELQEALQRAIALLCQSYLKTFGEEPAYIVSAVTSKPQVLDCDDKGEARVREGKVEWVRECSLGHLAVVQLALVACDHPPDGWGKPRDEHPYLPSMGLVPTGRKVTKDMDFSDIEAQSYPCRAVPFKDWLTEVRDRQGASHRLTSIDFPKERQIGFADHSAAETLACRLTDVKRGIWELDEGKLKVPGMKAAKVKEALKTNKGRAAFLAG